MVKGKVCHLGDAKTIHVQRWVNYFAENDWEVDLISFRDVDRSTLHPKVVLHVVSLSFIPILGFLTALFGTIKHLKQIKPDIVHAHSIAAYGIYAGLYSYINHLTPFILTAWGFRHIKKNKGLKRWLDRNAVKKADIITANVDELNSELMEVYNISAKKFITIPWGVDLRTFRRMSKGRAEKLRVVMNIPKDSWVLLSPRNAHPYYGLENIVKSMSYVIDQFPNTIFIFLKGYGNEEYFWRLSNKVEKMGLGDNARFVNKLLSSEEMSDYYNLSDAIISIPKTDQFAFCIIEAMVCGCIPIVADSVSPYHKYLEHSKNALFVDRNDSKDIAEKIIYCIKHLEIKEKFYRLNKQIVEEKEDWNKNSKKMEKLYERVGTH